MEPVQEHRSWVSSRFVAWFIHFDEHKLRPFLIRKYNIGNIVLADQLDDAMKRKIDDEDDLNASMRMMDMIQLQTSFMNSQVKVNEFQRSKS